ncbi:MAG: hypothetical protein CVU48_00475 [Candidatus Cloacimonetes bacterium HGW-Cloacimonetes-1]|jgi:ATP-dependent exoDNAse (exonuclease V) beta subunit|nr:MAG: hypothetical protein CVU48_00475 [Candidatus Cloacimonetes bacterium HGW-Cloacimonetes-1]
MNKPFIRIITASAGTGKTYRLSLEYIGLVIQYYEHPEFKIDNILVLTFTKKATAEIRERIFSQMQIMLSKDPKDEKDRNGLIENLRTIAPGDAKQLSLSETNILISAYNELSFNKNLLQVMTIDSYINSIFRNLVRPVRSIDNFEIDELAIDKRMPYLMDFVMKPVFRHRIQDLLRRKVSPSLDEYNKFFISMIKERWLHYMITKRNVTQDASSLCSQFLAPDTWDSKATESFTAFFAAMNSIIAIIKTRALDPKNLAKPLDDFFNKGFRELFSQFPESFPELDAGLKSITSTPLLCYKLLKTLDKTFWNMTKFPAKTCSTEREQLTIHYENSVKHLANYLVYCLFLPEQHEILKIWEDILTEYDNLIYRYKNMTYDDVSWFTFEALFSSYPPLFNAEDEAVATEFYHFLSHRSRFILIDEFQDTSLLQFNILCPIIEEVTSGIGSKPFGGAVVVGDEKQSIFSWRGGERDLLLNLPKMFGSSKTIETAELVSCWRSSPTLIRFVNSIFSNKGIHEYLNTNGMTWKYPPIQYQRDDLESLTEIQLCIQSYQTKGASVKTTNDEVFRMFINEMVKPNLTSDCKKTAILCRKGKDLTEIQNLLDELEVSSIFQPSASLLEHALVQPLLSWLRFIAYQDWLEFFAFLRSDYVMLNAIQLKECIETVSAYDKAVRICLQEDSPIPEIDFSALPLVQTLFEIAMASAADSIHQKCLRIIELCQIQDKLSERDYLNLHSFLSVIQEYELNNSDNGASIPSLIQYLQDNKKQSFMQQRSIDLDKSLELQTIHKSKGLEYDRVFVFYNLSGKASDASLKLRPYIDYAGDDFKNLRDFALSLHYKDILAKSGFGSIITTDAKRSLLEEMNTLYVAFTRAKTKLHIFFTYDHSSEWDIYLEAKSSSSPSLPLLLADACRSYMIDHAETTDYHTWSLRKTPPPPAKIVQDDSHTADPEKPEAKKVADIPRICLPDWQPPRPDFTDAVATLINHKQVWLIDRANLTGNIVHFYLSCLAHNTDSEIADAKDRTILQYCGILSVTEIKDILSRATTALKPYARIFEPKYDRVFTEFSVWNQGREYRIDRFMVDTAAKDVQVIDFKTGGIEDRQQLDHYVSMLSGLPAFQGKGYSFRAEYISLSL